jgi:hypothetical protein
MLKILVIQHNYLLLQRFEIFCKLIFAKQKDFDKIPFAILEVQKLYKKFYPIVKIFPIQCKLILMKEPIHGELKSNVLKCNYYYYFFWLLISNFNHAFSKDVRLPVSMQRSMAAEAEGRKMLSFILCIISVSFFVLQLLEKLGQKLLPPKVNKKHRDH